MDKMCQQDSNCPEVRADCSLRQPESCHLHDIVHMAQLETIPVFALLCLSVRVCMCVVPCVRCM